MGEIINLGDFREEKPKKKEDTREALGAGEPISFEKSKEVFELVRKYEEFDIRFKQLSVMSYKRPEEFEQVAENFIEDIENFEEEIFNVQGVILDRSEEAIRKFNEEKDKIGIVEADKKHGMESLREDDRLIKITDLANKARELRGKVVDLIG